MNKKVVLIASAIFLCGLSATLLSGFYRQDLSGKLGVMIVGYGFPVNWFKESWMVYPGIGVESSYCWGCFALDLAFWSFLVAMPVIAVTYRQWKSRVVNS